MIVNLSKWLAMMFMWCPYGDNIKQCSLIHEWMPLYIRDYTELMEKGAYLNEPYPIHPETLSPDFDRNF